ncbi:MAG TPA: YrhB domain-containing protein [Steroidobacteraceae bacterium]|nr:YrhB domain-containing protein [Steroidobacteraceae bacterium]
MFTRQHADQLVNAYLDEHEVATFDFDSPLPRHEDRHLKKLVIVRVDEHDFGWLYFYDSSAHVETGAGSETLAGNAPLIVDRGDGKLYVTGTAHPIEHYLQEYRSGHRTLVR